MSGTTQDVTTYDRPMRRRQEKRDGTGPNGTYRNCPFFSINKKEFRHLTKKNQLPKRVVDYMKIHNDKSTYVRYGTHLTFNARNFTPQEVN